MKFWRLLRNWTTHRIFVGLVVTFASYFLIDSISGGIFGGVDDVTSLQTTAFVRMDAASKAERVLCRATFSMRDADNILMEIDLFDDVLDRDQRIQKINQVTSMTLRFNFNPSSIVVPSSKRELSTLVEKCREGDFCLHMDQKLFRETYGHLNIQTGHALSPRSLSTRAIKIGLLAGKASTNVEVFVNLPPEWDVKRATPQANHISSFAGTQMIWEGDDRYGQSVPLAIGGDRAIAENLGIELTLENARLNNLETTLMFFLSALFGVGFTMVCEPLIAMVQPKKA